ncbi:MAG: LITAF-like zinc ribbon domain-containing protein [Gemmatimonadota bacterium]
MRQPGDSARSTEPRPHSASKATAPAGKSCPHCGSQAIGKVRGLQGVGEVLIAMILLCLFIVPGVLYYVYQESVPYCSGCGRRVRA